MRNSLLVATLVVALGTLITPSLAHADEDPCGPTELSDEARAALDHASQVEDAKADEDAQVVYHVPVYLHVVRKAPQGEGDMPVARARAITLDVVNAEFAAQNIPFVFDLAKIDYLTVDDATYHLVQNSDEERALWDRAQVTGRRNLNIYIVGTRTDTTVTGWAEFLVNPQLRRGDHVVLRYFPAKGGFSDPLVPVHEVGHWMGLLHTFQFGCGQLEHGDLIRDTPTQASGHHTCALHTDTCPDDPGEDPVDNIMGYSQGCRGTFSTGQIRRMKFLYRTVRGGKSDDLPVDDTTSADAGGCDVSGGAGGPLGGAGLLVAAIAFASRRRRA